MYSSATARGEINRTILVIASRQFSAVYPSPQTTISLEKHSTAQSLTWAVAAESDGTLVEKTSGAEISYYTSSQLVTPDGSRVASPVDDTETFDPSRPSVNPADSVVLPIGKVAGYLDAVLKTLALHTEARTSFITYASALPVLLKYKTHQETYWAPRYWLPDLLKHEYIALRFLSHLAGIIREGGRNAHLAHARRCHSRLYALPRSRQK
ncbi:hypothetical protein BC827DRAFT_1268364 [Russula dissimulans]|nr:hypothetical protein BC827DRAFT_1268364 [Russula dissimulans]